MPLDNANIEPTGPSFYCLDYKGKVSIHFYARNKQGISVNADLSPEECRRLIDQINEVINKMPRIGTAADLGVEVLP